MIWCVGEDTGKRKNKERKESAKLHFPGLVFSTVLITNDVKVRLDSAWT